MTVMSLLPPVTDAAEEYVGGYGHVPSKFMVVIPEAPLSATGIMPTTETQMGIFRHFVNVMWKEVYVTPLVKFRRSAKAKTLYAKDIRYWLPVLYEEIKIVQPKRILIMGKFAAKYLIPRFISMMEDHGTIFTVSGQEIDPTLSHLGDFIMIPTFSFNDLRVNLMAKDYFNNDMKRFSSLEPTIPVWETPETLSEIPLREGAKITIDVETGGFDLESEMHMVGVGYDDRLFIVWHPKPDDIASFMQHINDTSCEILFHNSPFDLAHLIRSSENKAPYPKKRISDVMVSAHISGVQHKSLKHLTSLHTNLPGPHSGGRFHDEQYLAEDLRSTLALDKVPELHLSDGTYADNLYHDLAPILVNMRLRGVYLNRDLLMELGAITKQKLHETTKHLHQLTRGDDINWNSAIQVSKKLLECGVPLTETTKTGQLSVSEAILEDLEKEMKELPDHYEHQILIIDTLLKYRAESKLVSGFLTSYLELLDEYDFLYPHLKLLGTSTGRLSCADPNLQQIPRKGDFKLCFEPRWHDSRYDRLSTPGYYGLVDFEGAELKMAAIVSGDRQMAEFILSGDPHSHMAKIAFPNEIPSDATSKEIKEVFSYWRKRSKSTTFAMLYGGSIKGIAMKNGVPQSEVAAVDTALRQAAPDLMNWLDMTKKRCADTLYIDTIFGNKRHLKEKFLYEGRGGAQRSGMNTPIQGAAGILALVVLRKLHNLSVERGLVSRPIFGVHDSVLSEIAEHEVNDYGRAVQDAYRDIENSPIVEYPVYHMLGITGSLDVGRNWAHVEDTNEHTDIKFSIKCDSRGNDNVSK